MTFRSALQYNYCSQSFKDLRTGSEPCTEEQHGATFHTYFCILMQRIRSIKTQRGSFPRTSRYHSNCALLYIRSSLPPSIDRIYCLPRGD